MSDISSSKDRLRRLSRLNVRLLLTLLLLAVIGYAIFVLFAVLYLFISNVLSSDVFKRIDWAAGLLCSWAFVSSEFVIQTGAKDCGRLRRLLFSSSIVAASVLACVLISSRLGWTITKPRQEETYYIRIILTIALSLVGIFVVRQFVNAKHSATDSQQ